MDDLRQLLARLADAGFGLWPDEPLADPPPGFDPWQAMRLLGYPLELDDSEFVEKFKAMAREGLAAIRELIVRDQRRGLIRPDLDPGFLLDIYYSINMKLLSDHYRNGGSDEVLLEKLAAVVDLMRRGAANGHPAS